MVRRTASQTLPEAKPVEIKGVLVVHDNINHDGVRQLASGQRDGLVESACANGHNRVFLLVRPDPTRVLQIRAQVGI